MTYRVEFTHRAARDLARLYEERHADESAVAARCYNGLENEVNTLEHFPRRCAVAPETRRGIRTLRHLLYGMKPRVYRVVYEIDEKQKTVRVLTIRHGAMEPAELGG